MTKYLSPEYWAQLQDTAPHNNQRISTMTTAELIALLQRMPQNAHIYTWDRFNGAYDEIDKEHIMYTDENIIYL